MDGLSEKAEYESFLNEEPDKGLILEYLKALLQYLGPILTNCWHKTNSDKGKIKTIQLKVRVPSIGCYKIKH